jgi:predicted nuclease with TOPRIM domain
MAVDGTIQSNNAMLATLAARVDETAQRNNELLATHVARVDETARHNNEQDETTERNNALLMTFAARVDETTERNNAMVMTLAARVDELLTKVAANSEILNGLPPTIIEAVSAANEATQLARHAERPAYSVQVLVSGTVKTYYFAFDIT